MGHEISVWGKKTKLVATECDSYFSWCCCVCVGRKRDQNLTEIWILGTRDWFENFTWRGQFRQCWIDSGKQGAVAAGIIRV